MDFDLFKLSFDGCFASAKIGIFDHSESSDLLKITC